uniref:ATP synthase subunit a n=1 Tax=Stenodactylus petrii TaxID=401535 RepID=A0A0A1HAM9_9SAUR|nr:ATPase subunit 6 [Stenodactylus petrii]
MMMNLFDQFSPPHMMDTSMMSATLLAPIALIYTKPRLTPSRATTIQTWLTTLFTKQILTPLNISGHTWAPLFLTTLTFLLLLNLLGLLPYTFTPTTQLSMNMALALPLWLATVLIGLRTQPTASLAHLLPMGTPPVLIPILIIIETISLLIRPLALAVRLTANLTAGHLLITLISMTALTLLTSSPTLSLLTTLLLILLTCLEAAVAIIQAYVFTLLLSLYLQENT